MEGCVLDLTLGCSVFCTVVHTHACVAKRYQLVLLSKNFYFCSDVTSAFASPQIHPHFLLSEVSVTWEVRNFVV